MKQMSFLLAALLLLTGCASSTRTSSRTIRTTDTTDQVAQGTYTREGGEAITSDRGGQGASVVDRGSAVIGERGGVETRDQAELRLHREELVVGKREVSNGGVLLRTVIETNRVTQPVELRREEYVIDRIPADQIRDQEGMAAATVQPFEGREIYIPLMREEAVAGKRALLTEQIRLAKRVETERVNVTRPVRSEDVEIVKVPGQAPAAAAIEETTIAAQGAPRTVAPEQALALAREELVVGKREVEHGGVRLRKVVRTQEASQPVELRREEYTIDRAPITGQVAETVDFAPRELRAEMRREEPVADVRSHVAEVIRVRKVVETDQQEVAATLRQERLEVIQNPEGGSAMGATAGSAFGGETTTGESGAATTTTTRTTTTAESGDDAGITERVQTMLSERSTWNIAPPPWQVDETYLRKGIDVRPPRNVPPSSLPPVSDLGEDTLNVSTAGGVVTLRGSVYSEAEKRTIGERVSSVPGVRSVNNELRVIRRSGNAPATRGTGAGTLQNGDF